MGWSELGKGMSLFADDSALMGKVKELCAFLVTEPTFVAHHASVEAFLGNDAARLQYQSLHERGDELNQKQRAGVQLSEVEIREFEAAREALFQNPVASEFMEAQRELGMVQRVIGQYVGMTLELGRVPTAEDFAAANQGGCCGGGGGSCGCDEGGCEEEEQGCGEGCGCH